MVFICSNICWYFVQRPRNRQLPTLWLKLPRYIFIYSQNIFACCITCFLYCSYMLILQVVLKVVKQVAGTVFKELKKVGCAVGKGVLKGVSGVMELGSLALLVCPRFILDPYSILSSHVYIALDFSIHVHITRPQAIQKLIDAAFKLLDTLLKQMETMELAIKIGGKFDKNTVRLDAINYIVFIYIRSRVFFCYEYLLHGLISAVGFMFFRRVLMRVFTSNLQHSASI